VIGALLDPEITQTVAIDILICDERIYSHVKSDVEVGVDNFRESKGKHCQIEIASSEVRETLESHLAWMVSKISESSFFVSSRYHPAISRLLSGKKATVIAHNNKFDVLKSFGAVETSALSQVWSVQPDLHPDFLEEIAVSWQSHAQQFLSQLPN
jgi:polysaccharide pyruvyl transferase WcaK-like protein